MYEGGRRDSVIRCSQQPSHGKPPHPKLNLQQLHLSPSPTPRLKHTPQTNASKKDRHMAVESGITHFAARYDMTMIDATTSFLFIIISILTDCNSSTTSSQNPARQQRRRPLHLLLLPRRFFRYPADQSPGLQASSAPQPSIPFPSLLTLLGIAVHASRAIPPLPTLPCLGRALRRPTYASYM